jgi:ClpP class serine protease
MDEKQGVSYTILRSKKEKAIYNPHEAISAEVIDKYTAILEGLDTLFNENVISNRTMLSLDEVISMQGNSYLATKAVEMKLADKIVANLDEVLSIVLSDVNPQPLPKGNIMTLEELKAQLSAKEADLAALQASVTNTVAKAITDERARCSEILTAGSTLKVSAELIAKRITAGSSKEDALDVFTAIAEAKGISTAIDTTTSIAATITDLPSNVTKLQVAGMEDLTVSGILEAAKASVKGVK